MKNGELLARKLPAPQAPMGKPGRDELFAALCAIVQGAKLPPGRSSSSILKIEAHHIRRAAALIRRERAEPEPLQLPYFPKARKMASHPPVKPGDSHGIDGVADADDPQVPVRRSKSDR